MRPPLRLAAVTLVVLVLLVFGQTVRHGFLLFDDDTYIFDNPAVRAGLSVRGVSWAFGFHARNWHPLTWLSHMLDVQLFQMHAGGHHLGSVLLHAANAALLCCLLGTLTGSFGRSLAAAAVFAVHPLRVESVAWAAERKDVLAALFWLLTTGAYVRYASRPGAGRFLAVLLLFALGLMAKPMLVTLPLVLLLLDWWPLGRTTAGARSRIWRRLLLEKAPLLALAAASSAVTWHAQTTGPGDRLTLSLAERVANALISYTVYLRQLAWPAGLAVLYPYTEEGHAAWAFAAAFLAVVSVLAMKSAGERPFLAVGWFWYLTVLVPVIGLVQVGWHGHADRYTYLPHIGIIVALVWTAAGLLPGRKWRTAAGGAAATAVVAALALAAFAQTAWWRDGAVLFRRTLELTRGNYRIMNNLGATLIGEGRFDEAIPVLRESLAINPAHASAAYNLGSAYYRLGSYEEATAWFATALQHQPSDPDAHYNAGLSFLRIARYAEAAEHFRQVLLLRPASPEARSMLGYALTMAGRLDRPPAVQ